MADDLLRYDVLAQEALRGLVRKVLTEVAQTGLPGDHHFFITFDTRHPAVRISPRLRAQYPAEMTIVLQHQFWDLAIHESHFEVGLSFNGVAELLVVPFQAINAFVDPHASFGLKFDTVAEAANEAEAGPVTEAAAPDGVPAEVPQDGEKVPAPAAAAQDGSASVVSLDAFRKKNG